MTDFTKYRRKHLIQSLYPYHRKYQCWMRVPNPQHNGWSAQIIRVKNGDESAINRMAASLVKELPLADVICTVPSSDAGNRYNGIRKTAMIVAEIRGMIDGTGCLFRKTSKPKSHEGGRDPESHYKTLGIDHADLIKGKRVILLDDVTTSGRSLVTGAEVLKAAGAADVIKYALGETVYYG